MKRVALITGASKGLGYAWAQELGQQGYSIILTARKLEQAEKAAATLEAKGVEVFPQIMDVTNEASIQAVAAWASQQFGKLDLLINNAGINSGTRAKGNRELLDKNLTLEGLEPSEVLNMVSINAIAPIIVARNFQSLLAQGDSPKIINIGSWFGSITITQRGGNYSYAVSKSALNMMNRSLSHDLHAQNITTVVVNPGWVSTDMGGQRAKFTPQQSVSQLIENVVNKISLEDSGKFFNYDGEIHPW